MRYLALFDLFSVIEGSILDVICNIAVCADDTTRYSKYQESDLWQQQELTFELESEVRSTGPGQEVAC